jgi:Mannosyltransferase putative
VLLSNQAIAFWRWGLCCAELIGWCALHAPCIVPQAVLGEGKGSLQRDSESGQLLLDLVRHADVLEYLVWVNSFGDSVHRALWGDKDTYALAFAVAGKAHEWVQTEVSRGSRAAAAAAAGSACDACLGVGVGPEPVVAMHALLSRADVLSCCCCVPVSSTRCCCVQVPPGGVFAWRNGSLLVRATQQKVAGWQLAGMLQFDRLGRPSFMHRTMNKLQAGGEAWPLGMLTGPLPYR